MLENILAVVLNPFLGFLVLAAMTGQFMKTQVFTTKRAVTKGKLRLFWKWARKTLPFHPVLTGAIVGIAWAAGGYDTPGWDGPVWFYFGAAGVFSTWGFAILKALFKPFGIEIDPSDT